MIQEPSHVKQLSPIHVCKIGLNFVYGLSFAFVVFRDIIGPAMKRKNDSEQYHLKTQKYELAYH